MGRLDDAAKRKVVELREAGLSFRKIKAVLELENIKVSAQAIYLFLKEYNGRNGTNLSAGRGVAGGQANAVSAGDTRGTRNWRGREQLGQLMREASRVAGFTTSPPPPPAAAPPLPPQQGGLTSEERGSGSTSGGSRQDKEAGREDEEEDIRIVSVTSLAQRARQEGVHNQRTNMATGVGAMTGIFARRRLTPSPGTNPVLLARKRLLDKALLHRARIRDGGPSPGQQVGGQPRRDQSWRNMMLPPVSTSIDLTTPRPQQARTIADGHPDARRGFQPRLGVLPPRVGVRLPAHTSAPTSSAQTASNPGVRIPHPANQPQRREPSPNYQPSALEALRQGIGDQVQALGTEVRSLSLAVRMLVEQQGRLEREQSQQTQVQKQILSTLQFLASRPNPCGLAHATSTSASASSSHSVPAASLVSATVAGPSYSQSSSFTTPVQSGYSQGALSMNDNSGLEGADAFSFTGISSAGGSMNGFSVTEPLQVAHTHTHTTAPAYSQALTHTAPDYTQQTPVQSHTHTQLPSPVLGHGHGHSQGQGLSHADAFADTKNGELTASQVDPNLQDCSASIPALSSLGLSSQEPQLNIIKVENI